MFLVHNMKSEKRVHRATQEVSEGVCGRVCDRANVRRLAFEGFVDNLMMIDSATNYTLHNIINRKIYSAFLEVTSKKVHKALYFSLSDFDIKNDL